MGATGQQYSDAALWHSEAKAAEAWKRGLGAADQLRIALDAAHDREALGLEVSVHAASYREELLRELADSFRPGPVDVEAEDMALFALETRARIQREVIEGVAAWLQGLATNNTDGHVLRWAAAELLREFEVPHGQ